ncbi:MAG TPA: hypothetical protein VGD94_19405 [Vicinamibacterales bacterium]
MSLETALGRWMACAVHPQSAWRILPAKGRALLLGTYFGIGYVAALLVLLAA